MTLCDFVLVAGGMGQRFQSSTPKQFEIVNGRPLYLWSLEAILNWESLGNVVVVVPKAWEQPVKESFKFLVNAKEIQVVTGGSSRQASVLSGLHVLENSRNHFVMIHDAARPCITTELIDRLWKARGTDSKAIVPGVPISETVKAVGLVAGDLCVRETLNRSELRLIQTPQLLHRAIAVQAHKKFSHEIGVDDAYLIEKMGHNVVVIDGDYDNLKVTFSEDMTRVSDWLRDRYPQV